jgi:hypothetical protein
MSLSPPFEAAYRAAEYQVSVAAAVVGILGEGGRPDAAALAVPMLVALRDRWDSDRAAVAQVADRLTAARADLGLGRAQYGKLVAANAHLAALTLSLCVQIEVEVTVRVHTRQFAITPGKGWAQAVDLSRLPECREAVRWQTVDLAVPDAMPVVADLRMEAVRADRDAGSPGGAGDPPAAPAAAGLPAIAGVLELIPGGFVYRKKTTCDLNGRTWEVLRALALAPCHRVFARTLFEDIWKGTYHDADDRESVSDAIGRVRAALKAARSRARLKKVCDPVPCKDDSLNLCWELDLEQL